MPGKVNPVIPEVVNQVAFEVIGNDVTIREFVCIHSPVYTMETSIHDNAYLMNKSYVAHCFAMFIENLRNYGINVSKH